MHRMADLDPDPDPRRTAWILQGGQGSTGFTHRIDDEYHRDLIFSGKYQLAMAKSAGDDNAGSQWFITQSPTRVLDFDYPIFGQMVRGFSVLDDMFSKVGKTDGTPETPKRDINITNVEVVKNRTDAVLIIRAPRGTSGTIRVTASDGTNTDAQSFEVRGVADSNNAEPWLRAPLVDRIVAGGKEYFDVRLKAFDLEGEANLFFASYQGQDARWGLVENDLLRIVPNKGYRGPLAFDVWVYRSGGSNLQSASMDSQRVVFMVGEDPITDVRPAIYNGTVGTDVQDTLLTFRDTNPNGKVTDFTASINWGDGTAASTGTITQDQDGTFRVRGTHKYAVVGKYKVVVSIQSNENFTSGTRGTLKRVVVNAQIADAAIVGNKAVIVGKEDEALSGVVVGTFTTNDTRDTTSDFVATVEWEGGVQKSSLNPEDGVIVTGSAGTFTITGVYTYDTAGTYPVKVTVKDRTGGATTVISSEAFIDRSSLTVGSLTDTSVIEATTDNYQVNAVAVTDEEAGHTYTARVNWGEGDADDFEDLVLTPVSDGTNKRATFDLKHTYAESGSYPVTVIITDENGVTATRRQTITVGDKPPTIGSITGPTTAVRGELVTIRLNDVTDDSEKDSDRAFTYEITWGDGSTSTTSDTPENRLQTVSHTYLKTSDDQTSPVAGKFRITIKVRDADMTSYPSDTTLHKTLDVDVNIAELRTDPDDPNVSHLYIGGFNQATTATVNDESRQITEEIQVMPDPDNPGQIKVVINNHQTANDFTQSFAAPSGSQFGRIVVFDGGTAGGLQLTSGATSDLGGNDLVRIDPDLANDVELYGSSGNDTLIASGGDDILYGGAGDDDLYGRGGRDFLLGGNTGAVQGSHDLLKGGDGEDMLVGGRSVYDTRRDVLRRIADEWNRADVAYSLRVDHILGESDGGLNGNFRLRPDKLINGTSTREIGNDFGRDVLHGEGGRDFFFYFTTESSTSTTHDSIVDHEDGERRITLS
jgi:cyclophilin family peptidyl-prolyl cis-trans isomerase